MNLSIRKAKIEDIKQYTEMLQETYQDTYTNPKIGLTADCFSLNIFNTEDTQKYLGSHLVEVDNQKTWLVFNGNELVGSSTCIIKDDNEAELTGYYVRPRMQGQGIGRQLYNLVLAFADNRDLVLDIYTHNTEIIKLYEKWGWTLDASRGENGFFTRHWPEWPDGLEAKCMYMRLNNRK